MRQKVISKHSRPWSTFFVIISSLVLFVFIGTNVMAEEKFGDTSAELRNKYVKSLKGKTIGFVPITLGMPLFRAWGSQIKREAEEAGMKYIGRDPNWSGAAMTQAVTALIDQHVDVLVVHNINVSLLAKLLKRAEKAGIYVIQVNMVSNYKTDCYVGADWHGMGETVARDMVKMCGKGTGKSGKVAIMVGESTSAPEIETYRALRAVLANHPEIKLVSDQASNWDANKAHDIMATILQQHPDLCYIYGNWGVMMYGPGQAAKEAGLADSVIVAASGGGPPDVCEAIKTGVLDRYWTYFAPRQGHDIMAAAKMLLQSGLKPGTIKVSLYSPMELITKDNADYKCWWREED